MKNQYTVADGVVEVTAKDIDGTLTSFYVDADDLPLICTIGGSWRIKAGWKDGRRGNRYVTTSVYLGNRRYKTVMLHRLIMNPPSSLMVDHINGDTLDNRRSNLRWATRSQNSIARNSFIARSGIRGVTEARPGYWQVMLAGKYVGSFRDRDEAASAYRSAVVERYGEFAPQIWERD